mgnify:CR=1 FL=1
MGVRKMLVMSTVIGLASVALVGCNVSQDPSGDPNAAEEQIVLRVAHATTEDSVYAQGIYKLGEELEKRTDGRIVLEVFANAQLGNETEQLDLLGTGDVDITVQLIGASATLVPEVGLLDALFLFDSEEHFRAFGQDERAIETLNGYIAAHNQAFQVGCLSLSGIRSVYSNTGPITSMSDLAGISTRVVQSETSVDMWSALGTVPTAVPFTEVYNALSLGVVDAAENSALWYLDSRHVEVAKYFSQTEHQFAVSNFFVSTRALEALSEDLRTAFDESIRVACQAWTDLAFETERELMDQVVAEGGIVTPASAGFRADMQAAIEPRMEGVIARTDSQSLYDLIVELRP